MQFMRPEDHLAIIACKEEKLNVSAIQSSVDELCLPVGRSNHETVILERTDASQSIYKRIQQYLIDESNKDNYVDFVAVGNAGMNFSSNESKNYLGSVASMVLRAKRMNVIFCP